MRQLDLFNDTLSIQKANCLSAVLLMRDWDAMPSALSELVKVDDEGQYYPKFKQLCTLITHALTVLASKEIRYEECSHLGEMFQSTLASQANLLMGSAGNEWICSFWSELAEKFERIGERGKEDSVEAYLKAHRWSDVLRVVNNSFLGKEMRSSVQRWLCLGYLALGHRNEAIQSLLRYAWLSPEGMENLIQESSCASWAQFWQGFQRDIGDLENDWFPAWYLHEFRPLEWRFESYPGTVAARAYQVLLGLLLRESRGIDSTLMADRAKLKGLSPEFFAFYLRYR